MSSSPVKTIAAQAARSVGRRLRARRQLAARPAPAPAPPRLRERAEPVAASIPLPVAAAYPAGEPEEQRAGDGELDALRGALVRELDRLATDDECSASFRRAG